MKKLVVKLELHDDKDKQKALKTVSTLRGIDAIAMDMKERKLTVIGTVDPVNLVGKLRKYWETHLVFVGPAKEEKKEEPKKEEPKKEDAPKDAQKKEEGGGKEEPQKEEGAAKKEGESKPDEGKKDDEKKDDSKKDTKKEEEPAPKKPQFPFPPPQQFNPYMMGYRPPFNPYMNPGPYNPYMNGYNPYVTTHNPYMVTPNPPVTTHYYVQNAEENPSICTIC